MVKVVWGGELVVWKVEGREPGVEEVMKGESDGNIVLMVMSGR